MELYSENKSYKLYHGNMLDMLDNIEPCSIDSIVTDPPYELNFMNKGWDNSGIAFQKETWEKCLLALKPGGYLLAFGGSRTFHRIACAIEDAGFEIRDTIMWLYGSGFPKSMNLGLAIDKKNGVESEIVGVAQSGSTSQGFNARQEYVDSGVYLTAGTYSVKQAKNAWQGWGTSLKPAYEPIIVGRKPCEGTCVDNVIKYGVGGINIDECRIPEKPGEHDIRQYINEDCFQNTKPKRSKYQVKPQPDGRFPANVILTYDETDFDEVCGNMPYTDKSNGSITKINYKDSTGASGIYGHYSENVPLFESYNDSGSACRYFYCAKASNADRDEGLGLLEIKKTGELQGGRQEGSAGSIMLNADGTSRVNPYAGIGTPKRNNHPTVKPTDLMRYLIRLVTPNGGIVLDPFNGSGSTGKAAMYENMEHNKDYKYIGIELSEEYLEISKARIENVHPMEKQSSRKLNNGPKTMKLF